MIIFHIIFHIKHLRINETSPSGKSHRHPPAPRLHLEKECVLDSDWAYDDQDWAPGSLSVRGWFIVGEG